MRFYVPEWDDHVDADYDFVHDEHSALEKSERNMAYIWDIFDYETTPIDGLLISREQVEDTSTKFDRLTSHGVYEDPLLDLPEWVPTISDCGAWGYKSLPFPPYGNEDMLDFYEALEVSIGVTIDHLVLGSGHSARLYLDERAFSDSSLEESDLPSRLTDAVDDVMVDEWPESWPPYVDDYEPSIRSSGDVEPFSAELFHGDPESVLQRLADDPRAVYRPDDMQFRYDLSLDNAAEMRDLLDEGDYSFRPMVAIQGWDEDSYRKAAERVLEMGYQYLGIGGVAGSSEEVVKDITEAVGNEIQSFELEHETRIDCHVFGFAKTGAFETIGRSGMSSFDSASMLRAAWTGGENYHLDSDTRYDALRVRYPGFSDDLETAVEKALRAQELLHALRAFDDGRSIATALREWNESAKAAIDALPSYLEEERGSSRFDHSRLREVEAAFRADYDYARELKASFSDSLRGKLIKLLREEDADEAVPWGRYLELISTAHSVFDGREPTLLSTIEEREAKSGEQGTFDQLWPLVESYTAYVDDEELQPAYEDLLLNEPWRECDCAICSDLGIEVAIFRGNNRNRRRGFHNTHRFYQEFAAELPRLLVVTKGDAQLSQAGTVETYLQEQRREFWSATHDLPVAEVGVVTADGIHEWWAETPSTVSFAPDKLGESLEEECVRYQDVFVDVSDGRIDEGLRERIESQNCTVHTFKRQHELRKAVFDRLGFPMQSLLSGF